MSVDEETAGQHSKLNEIFNQSISKNKACDFCAMSAPYLSCRVLQLHRNIINSSYTIKTKGRWGKMTYMHFFLHFPHSFILLMYPTFTFSSFSRCFIQSDLQLGVHKYLFLVGPTSVIKWTHFIFTNALLQPETGI